MGYGTEHGIYDVCCLVANDTNSTLSNCSDSSVFFSIPLEWNLTDTRGKMLTATITTAQMAGVLVGSIVVGQISDQFGRRKTFLFFFTLLALVGFLSSFSPSWQLFIFFRILIGFGIGGVISVHFVMLVEMLPVDKRLILYYGGWPVGFMWLSLLAYLLPHWKWLSVTINAFAPIPLLITIFLVYESPKWLLERHRYTEAAVVLERIAKRNGSSQQSITHLLVHLNDQAKVTDPMLKKEENYRYWHLFRNRTATEETLSMAFSWMVVSSIYYYFLFNTGSLAGHPSLNTTLMSLGRLMLNIFLQNLDLKLVWLGRRLMQQAGLGAIIFFFLLTILCETAGWAQSYPAILTVLSLFGLSFCGPVWISAEMYTAEIFPTALRNMGNGLCNSTARIGSMIAPQVILLAMVWPPLPSVLLAILAVVNLAVAFLWLPETKGRPLPDLSDEKEVADPPVKLSISEG